MIRPLLYCLMLITAVSACKSDKTPSPANNSTPSPAAVSSKHPLPAMTQAFYDDLRQRCTAVDYIFHTMPFSVNQTEKSAVLSNLAMISSEQADALPADCQPFAREVFQADGEIFLEADIYYTEGCDAYIFYKGKTAVYANKIAPSGKDFYNKLMSQVRVTPQ